MKFNRRDVLVLGGCTITGALSGCQAPLVSGNEDPDISFEIINYSTEAQVITVTVTEELDGSGEVVLGEEYEVPAGQYVGTDEENPELEPGVVRKEDVLDLDPYRVSMSPKGGCGPDNWGFSPTHADEDSPGFTLRYYDDPNCGGVRTDFTYLHPS